MGKRAGAFSWTGLKGKLREVMNQSGAYPILTVLTRSGEYAIQDLIDHAIPDVIDFPYKNMRLSSVFNPDLPRRGRPFVCGWSLGIRGTEWERGDLWPSRHQSGLPRAHAAQVQSSQTRSQRV